MKYFRIISLYVEHDYATKNSHNSKINSVVSTPFEEAHSKPLLDGFDFERGEGSVVFLQLSKIEDIELYIADKLKKYCSKSRENGN